ncbi:prolactin-releasing peptide receptor-like isoform X2 [Venturia canescens]|uniref:prolactin-releasing peptide receptor-like isoform X2 n=1 Tax=Venturia canescens TaxID=32260 RepID=UPI001C9BFE15|nr:prolactin-releasing peptide receptor-like isoform X2 [Venturia canescens]
MGDSDSSNGTSSNNASLLSNAPDFTSDFVVQMMFCIFYGNIFVLGVFGNMLVCYVVARNRQMQTVTNLFITNLALSDILLCFLAVPFTPLYTFLGGWVFGKTLCHLVPYAQGVSIYISTLTLTGIAVDRFLVIIYPFHPRMKIEVCQCIIIGIWIVALLVTLPYGLYMNLEESNTFCEEKWPSDYFRMIFSSMTTILQFVVPFFVIAFCYVCVSMKLNNRARLKPGRKTSRREEADRERKRRTNRMLIAMVAIFGVSWLPLNIVNVVDDFYVPANDWSYYRLCFFISHCLAMSSVCYNPFLYAWLNDNFRKEFKQANWTAQHIMVVHSEEVTARGEP